MAAASASGAQGLGSGSAPATRVKIYTGTGDTGEASLFNGQRAYKDSDVFAALGDVDELNSSLGVAKEWCRSGGHAALVEQIDEVQSRLLDIGSVVATPPAASSVHKLRRVAFDGAKHVAVLESWIDAMDERLPQLRNFILPGGGHTAAFLHHARSICRRAERSLVVLLRQDATDPTVCAYVNRLSDYLFTAARFAAMSEDQPEQVYKKAMP